jgi:hypothetical protein
MAYCHILGMLNHLSRTSAPASDDQYSTSIPLSFEAVAIIVSLNSPDHEQDELVLDALHEEGLCYRG